MSARKTPVLLRRAPFSGDINALTNYRRVRDAIRVTTGGKHDVTADFDAIVCELLLDDAPDICAILDGAAQGFELVEDEREQARKFHKALVTIVERHNTTGHGS